MQNSAEMCLCLEECDLPLEEELVHLSVPLLFSSSDQFQTLLLLFVAHYPSPLQPFSSRSKTHLQKRSSAPFLAFSALRFLSYQDSCCSDYRTQQLLPPSLLYLLQKEPCWILSYKTANIHNQLKRSFN